MTKPKGMTPERETLEAAIRALEQDANWTVRQDAAFGLRRLLATRL